MVVWLCRTLGLAGCVTVCGQRGVYNRGPGPGPTPRGVNTCDTATEHVLRSPLDSRPLDIGRSSSPQTRKPHRDRPTDGDVDGTGNVFVKESRLLFESVCHRNHMMYSSCRVCHPRSPMVPWFCSSCGPWDQGIRPMLFSVHVAAVEGSVVWLGWVDEE